MQCQASENIHALSYSETILQSCLRWNEKVDSFITKFENYMDERIKNISRRICSCLLVNVINFE